MCVLWMYFASSLSLSRLHESEGRGERTFCLGWSSKPGGLQRRVGGRGGRVVCVVCVILYWPSFGKMSSVRRLAGLERVCLPVQFV